MFEDVVEVSSGSGKEDVEQQQQHLHPHQLLRPISRTKYPALTMDEEQVSLPLQTLTLALFDVVLMWMMLLLRPDGSWHEDRVEICQHLVWDKGRRSREILEDTYGEHDLLFLQEVSEEFVLEIVHGSKVRFYS